MNIIFKYRLRPNGAGECEIAMPVEAKVLHVDWQATAGGACLWVMCPPDSSAPQAVRTFLLLPTGMAFDANGLEFVGTFLTDLGQYVWHVFEQVSA